MKITFVQDHQSPASGNERYAKGAQADLPGGQWLVDAGIAYAGWEPPKEPDQEPAMAEVVSFADLTKQELIDLAKQQGIPYSGRTKDDLIDALEEAQ